ncbi:DUF262 domain-containing protein [Gimesia maris]|uniref:DUF262 domain-containing protein n=1 Tax=Gimesia maris TaxID=122 RepID=UPI003A95A0E2
MKIESKDTDVESLLDSGYYYIPRFQRPYSWDDENNNDFWKDIVENPSEDYFIGSMVVYKKSKQKYGVVDGQQRLTTITILLCVIRDQLLDLNASDLAKGLHQLIERKDRDNQDEYVLRTETSFPYFQEYIQKYNEDPDADCDIRTEEENLKNAHLCFQNLVGSILESVDNDQSISGVRKKKIKIQRLTELRDLVLNLNLIFITLDHEDDAYIIFETLNTRGKDLALTDLVKNHFSKHLKSKGGVDHARLKWERMLDTIHNSSADISPDTFIYHFWASRYESVPQKKLFPKLKKEITKSKAKDYLKYLESDSKLYRSLHEITYGWNKNEKDAARSLGAMQLFKLSQPIPATLSLVRAYKDGKIKYARLRDTLLAIEKFHFQFTAITSSRSSGGISAMYSSFAQKLYDSTSSQGAALEIKQLVEKLRERVPSLDEFIVAFKEVHLTNSNSKQKNLVRYILRKLSENFKYKYPVDYDELTVEHLYSQSKIDERWTEDIVGSIGNLIFLDEEMNVQLSSKSVADKKKLLVKADYVLPEYIKNAKDWTPKQIIDNTERLARIAYDEVWKI